MIQELDTSSSSPRSILLCTHAAAFTAISRVLTGSRPESPTEQDFIPWTASLSTFHRRQTASDHDLPTHANGQALPRIPWANGNGIKGGWDCVVNADCSFLANGRERGWRFSGKESFSHTVESHGVDSGSGLGVIIEDEKSGAEREGRE